VTNHGIEYEIKTPDDIHLWPGGTRLALASGGGYDPALELAPIKLVKVDPVEKPLTDKISIDIDHSAFPHGAAARSPAGIHSADVVGSSRL
jgi:hypothetical protein